MLATLAVLDAQVGRYDDLPKTIDGLHGECNDPNSLDMSGMFGKSEDGAIVFLKGKYRGRSLDEIAQGKPDYLEWMLREDYFDDTKTIVSAALRQTSVRAIRDEPITIADTNDLSIIIKVTAATSGSMSRQTSVSCSDHESAQYRQSTGLLDRIGDRRRGYRPTGEAGVFGWPSRGVATPGRSPAQTSPVGTVWFSNGRHDEASSAA